MSDSIVAAALAAAVHGELACADAHRIAAELGVTPLDVARAVNTNTALRFNRCQLGTFGFGLKSEGHSKIVLKAAYVPDDIRAAVEARASNGAIPCLAVWEISEEFRYPRLGLANICEALGLKVKPCQLGCF
ncbi:MAG: hypothetical protein V1772_05155 [Chloroflexota bacterium]